MKKFVLLFLFLILSSCSLYSYNPVWDSFAFDDKHFENVEQICTWVNKNISYDHDKLNRKDYSIQTPQMTLMLKKGICTDFAVLIAAIAYYQFGDQSYIAIVSHCHSLTEIHHTFYDGVNGVSNTDYPYQITNRIYFKDIFLKYY